MKGSKEIKIGVTMVVAIGLLIFGVNFMADLGMFNKTRVLFAKYERMDGLTIGNKVELNGYKIGTVKSRIFFTRKKLMENLKDFQ